MLIRWGRLYVEMIVRKNCHFSGINISGTHHRMHMLSTQYMTERVHDDYEG